MKMAVLARRHGAGRFALEDEIDPHVGFVLEATQGTEVKKNQPMFTFHHTRELSEEDLQDLKAIGAVVENKPQVESRLLELIDSSSTKA